MLLNFSHLPLPVLCFSLRPAVCLLRERIANVRKAIQDVAKMRFSWSYNLKNWGSWYHLCAAWTPVEQHAGLFYSFCKYAVNPKKHETGYDQLQDSEKRGSGVEKEDK